MSCAFCDITSDLRAERAHSALIFFRIDLATSGRGLGGERISGVLSRRRRDVSWLRLAVMLEAEISIRLTLEKRGESKEIRNQRNRKSPSLADKIQ